ncbi:unnamed protein product [Rotaria sp. Silwood2]|nr:unnamed protein product [Rotaria sp. Silwood2]
MPFVYSLQQQTNPVICVQLCSKVNIVCNFLLIKYFSSLGLINNNIPEKVFDLLEEMKLKPDNYNLTVLFNACAQLANDRAMKIGRKLLHEMPVIYRNDTFLLNSAMHMLMKFGDIQSAERIFNSIKKKDIITYNAIMKGNIYEIVIRIFSDIS